MTAYRLGASVRRHYDDGDVVIEPVGAFHAVPTSAADTGRVRAVCGAVVETLPDGPPWPTTAIEGPAGSCTVCCQQTGV